MSLRKNGTTPRRLNLVLVVSVVLTVVIFFRQNLSAQVLRERLNGLQSIVQTEVIGISGFIRTQDQSRQSCHDGLLEGQLQVSESVFLESDLVAVAGLIVHPMIDYTNLPDLTFAEQVERTWAAIAGSSVWLQHLGVYFSVKRVFYYNRSDRFHPKISFIYAQIFDEAWQRLENFTVSWQGEDTAFPRVLSISAPFNKDGRYYGPEDPRLILEGVEDAEPVIVFNMMSDVEKKTRQMYIHRPFSNVTATLQIANQTPRKTEKNWTPFFLLADSTGGNKVWPSKHAHFVYDWHPLTVLRCHLFNGYCSITYQETIPEAVLEAEAKQDKAMKDVVHGGSNLEPLHLSSATSQAFVGFPRVRLMSPGCKRGAAIYRPILTLLVSNTTHFAIAYMSEALDFGHTVLTSLQSYDVCAFGRILIANSIARLELQSDKMILSYTVDDSTIQIGIVEGIASLLKRLDERFGISTLFEQNATLLKYSAYQDVMACTLERSGGIMALRADRDQSVSSDDKARGS